MGAYEVPIGYGNASMASIVFRPGAASNGNIINNAADVATAIAAVHGAANVYVDDAFAAPIIPAGVTWDFHGFGSILGRTTFPTLEVQDGGQILHLLSLVNVNVLCDCQTIPTFDYGTEYPLTPSLLVDYSDVTLSAACTLAPFQVPAGGGLALSVFANSGFFSSAAGTVPFVQLGAGATLFLLQANQEQGNVPANFVADAGTGVVVYTADDSALPVPIWTLFSGTESAPTVLGPLGPLHWTFANSTETLPAAPFTHVFIDSSGGQPTFNLPAGSLLQDGWKFLFSDNSPGFGAGTGGAWAIHTPQLLTTDGSLVQSCTTPMAATIGFSLPPMNGGYAELTWNATDQIWYVTRSSLVIFTSGLTAARPTAVLTSNDIGVPYFDVNLGFPVFWNGAAWVNAAGVPS